MKTEKIVFTELHLDSKDSFLKWWKKYSPTTFQEKMELKAFNYLLILIFKWRFGWFSLLVLYEKQSSRNFIFMISGIEIKMGPVWQRSKSQSKFFIYVRGLFIKSAWYCSESKTSRCNYQISWQKVFHSIVDQHPKFYQIIFDS